MLDLVGYCADRPLYTYRLLEPSCGDGDFLLIAIERLLASWQRRGSYSNPFAVLAPCLCAVELNQCSFTSTRCKVIASLKEGGLAAPEAERLAEAWLMQGDFLLMEQPEPFDFVVGNPPYIRQELIPDVLITEYRMRYRTMFDRADIYIPFIERSLALLTGHGTLGFICANRWLKNRYGGPLRRMVADHYHLKAYVDMTNTPAFHTDVIAYPAITVITRAKANQTRVAYRPPILKAVLDPLAQQLRDNTPLLPGGLVAEVTGITAGDKPWILGSPHQLMLMRRLERYFPTIEEAGCTVGIGVATGADQAFIGPFKELDVEEDRKLPLAMTRDIASGKVKWCGLGIVNTFTDDGSLVNLNAYPLLKQYLEQRRSQIIKRYVAQRKPSHWYRTIDRIDPTLAGKPKLLIPDIKDKANIVYEEGRLYPHHNLYFILAHEWDLRALCTVLRSGIANFFISLYATPMRGNYLRFQAQYLRRIRIPLWKNISDQLKIELVKSASHNDNNVCRKAVTTLYNLSDEEQATIFNNDDE